MEAYVQIMQARPKAKNLGYKREFLRDLLKEVKIECEKVMVTYRLPLEIEPGPGAGHSKKSFFTELELVVAVGLEPTTSRM